MLPDAFRRYLVEYDPLLELRWGSATKCWVIERKLQRPMSKGEKDYLFWSSRPSSSNPIPSPEAVEDWNSASASARRVAFTNILDNTILDRLKAMDTRRNARGLQSEQRLKREAVKRRSDAMAHEKAKAAADIVHHLLTKRDSDMIHGHTDEIMRAAIGLPALPKKKPQVAVPSLVDAYGTSIVPPKKDPKIQLSTR